MYIHIDSRNRPDQYDSANTFVLTLQEPIKNISKACVRYAKIGSGSPIGTERYMFIDIVELRSDQMIDVPKFTFISSESFESLNVNKFLGIIPNTGNYYEPSSEPIWSVYQTPLDSIYKLSIRVTDYKGVPIDLGSEEFTLLLDIETIVPPPVQEVVEEDEATPPQPEVVKRIPVHLLVIVGLVAIFLIIRPFR